MQIAEILQSIMDHAGAHIVYGDPVTAGAKTILPVASIRCGFGAGSGRKPSETGEGSGVGGGLLGKPAGVVEITPEQTRFIPIRSNQSIALAATVGFCLGALVARRRRR